VGTETQKSGMGALGRTPRVFFDAKMMIYHASLRGEIRAKYLEKEERKDDEK
jgi:hypothetical protein